MSRILILPNIIAENTNPREAKGKMYFPLPDKSISAPSWSDKITSGIAAHPHPIPWTKYSSIRPHGVDEVRGTAKIQVAEDSFCGEDLSNIIKGPKETNAMAAREKPTDEKNTSTLNCIPKIRIPPLGFLGSDAAYSCETAGCDESSSVNFPVYPNILRRLCRESQWCGRYRIAVASIRDPSFSFAGA